VELYKWKNLRIHSYIKGSNIANPPSFKNMEVQSQPESSKKLLKQSKFKRQTTVKTYVIIFML